MTGCIPKQTCFELVGAEEPLDAGLVVHDQGSYEVPISRFVEGERASWAHRETKGIETHPPRIRSGKSARVTSKEKQIRIASRPVAPVSRMHAAARTRQVADAQWVSARKRGDDLARCPLNGCDQRGSAESSRVVRPQAPITLSSIRQG
jgi:hypothetical protein